jgi:transcriptional regulator with XRE-family HTH domain
MTEAHPPDRRRESGNGNPGFASIEKIAEAFGLAVVFVKKDTVAEILDGEARAREKARSREADLLVKLRSTRNSRSACRRDGTSSRCLEAAVNGTPRGKVQKFL